jgi:thiol-disulfide isomerase/thioredoxin
MIRCMKGLVIALVASTIPALWAAELGDAAAPLKIKDWVKGKPVEIKADGPTKAYVVEFWATWCGPCRTSIPHLTELAKQYKEKGIVFIGVSDEETDKVKPFVERMGEKMDYVVAVDSDRATSNGYMKAYDRGGIPCAFLVSGKGKVIWIGHPMAGLDAVLEKLTTGGPTAEADILKQSKDVARVEKAVTNYLQKTTAGETVKFDDTVLSVDPKNPGIVAAYNQLAWVILTAPMIKDRDLSLALRVAKLASDGSGGESPEILDTYAKALWDNGKKKEAIEAQQKAVNLAKEEKMKAELQQRLDEYKAGGDVK